MPTMEALATMALSRGAALARVTALEPVINEHLVKLLGGDVPESTRDAWRRELRTWFRRLGRIGLKPDGRRLREAELFDLLWEGPFGGNETRNVATILDEVGEDVPLRPECDPAEVAARLADFYRTAATRLARGEPVDGLIDCLEQGC